MKLKYLLKKTINIKTSYMIIVMITLILIIGGCFSYAVFTTRSEAKGALNIVTGNLYSLIDSTDLDANKSVTLEPNETKIVTLTLTNANGIDSKVNLYYSSTSANIEIGYLSNGDAAPSTSGYVLGKNGSTTDKKKIYVKITNNDIVNSTISFGSDVGLPTAALAFPSGKSALSLIEGTVSNSNILVAYTYDDINDATKCITGEETTCQVTKCYENNTAESCQAGTIIKYAVNDTEDKIFYVLHDDGENMTLQQRENTISNVAWYTDSNDNTKGPLTILPLLEEATKEWINVEDQTYTMGTTNFNNTNTFTGCIYYDPTGISCTANKYIMESRTSKSRMITAQEATAMGCKSYKLNGSSNASCPKWMYNHLYETTNYEGTVNDNTTNDNGTNNYGYWTMTAYSDDSEEVWNIYRSGSMNKNNTSDLRYGARAVIVVSKNK